MADYFFGNNNHWSGNFSIGEYMDSVGSVCYWLVVYVCGLMCIDWMGSLQCKERVSCNYRISPERILE